MPRRVSDSTRTNGGTNVSSVRLQPPHHLDRTIQNAALNLSVLFALVGLAVLPPASVPAQTPSFATVSWASEYRVHPNLPNLAGEATLDVYARKGGPPTPVVLWWDGGAASVLRVLPFLEMGLNVVVAHYGTGTPAGSRGLLTNVDLARRVVDGRCALRWVTALGPNQGFDTGRIIVGGTSAGAYTAMMTGLVSPQAGFDDACMGADELKTAAILNFIGPMLPAAMQRTATRLEPLTYLRVDQPPILTVHGDADKTVPFAWAVELDEAFGKIGAPHGFLRIPEGVHNISDWNAQQLGLVWAKVRDFLSQYDLLPTVSAPGR